MADDDEVSAMAVVKRLTFVGGSRNRRRNPDVPRSRTTSVKRITRAELRAGALLYPPLDVVRPATRAECCNGPRPCGFVGCRHHLYLEINAETGSIKLNFPDLEPWELAESCSLDVADRGGHTLEQVGEICNLTRERIRQVETRASHNTKAALVELGIGADVLADLGVDHSNPEPA